MAHGTRRPRPRKIVLDLAVSLAISGDCLADIAQLCHAGGVRAGRPEPDGVARRRRVGRARPRRRRRSTPPALRRGPTVVPGW